MSTSILRPIARINARSIQIPIAHFSTSFISNAAASSSTTPASPSKTKAPRKIISSCPAGTRLTGLAILKDQPDLVALPDEDYPPWLWNLLDDKVTTMNGEGENEERTFDFKTERRKLRATNLSNIKAKNYLKTT